MGYYQAPHLWADGLKWWHGTWIQVGIPAFRPLSSYLFWIECWIGLHWGFLWSGWLGFWLFVLNCLLVATLAWRLTQSRLCAVLAAVMATWVRFINVGQQDYWLIWFPVHQELFMHALMIGALLCFDIWYERAERRYLIWSWLLFLAGCLAKEHVYIFPLFALTVVITRRHIAHVQWQTATTQAVAMLCAVLLLWQYRAAIIADPRNPSLKPIQFVHKPLLFMYSSAGRYLITGQWWFPVLLLLIFALSGTLIKLHHLEPHQNTAIKWLNKLYISFPLALLTIALYLMIVGWSLTDAFWFIFDQPVKQAHGRDAIDMLVNLYAIFLLWKYRKTESTAAVWLFLFLSYAPVLDFIGWHYTLPASLIRSVYWAYFLKLVWLDFGRPQPWRRLLNVKVHHSVGLA